MKKKFVAINAVLLSFVLLSSCSVTDLGSSSLINVETTVKANGSVVQMLVLETNTYGLTTETAESWLESLKKEGWDVTAISSSQVVTLTAQRDFSQREFQSYVPTYQMVAANLYVNNNIVFKEYVLNMSLRALTVDEEGAVQDSLLQIIGLALAEQRLKTSWTVTMPGTLTEANTDNISGNSATWLIDSNNIMQGVPVTVASRSVYWPGVAATISVILLAVLLLLYLIRHLRKTKTIESRVLPGSVMKP